MTTAQILEGFEEVTEVRADSKHRVALGKIEVIQKISHYKVYRNDDGLIILEPLVTIPAREAWLYKNKKALADVRAGLEEARAGKANKAKEDYTKYTKE